MNAYMGFSRSAGPAEGAILIFADNRKDARRILWSSGFGDELTDGHYIDAKVRRMKDEPWLFKEMKKDTPHVIPNPRSCTSCNTWGSKIGDDNLCDDCRAEVLI
jgi:hypothetical protein